MSKLYLTRNSRQMRRDSVSIPTGNFVQSLRGFVAVASILVFSALTATASAEVDMNDVRLLAVTKTKAIVTVRGERYVLKKGESTPEGVRLLKSDTNGATLSNGVREETIPLDVVTQPVYVQKKRKAKTTRAPDAVTAGGLDAGDDGLKTVTLYPDRRGSFLSDGTVNGRPLRFLVDTGASIVALSSETARQVGLDLSNGLPGIANTASGTAPMWRVIIPELTIGEIIAYNVEAGVIEGSFPTTPLLGMSFLDKVNMTREGDVMTLSERW